MRDMVDILQIIKRAAVNAVLAMKLSDIVHGTVLSVSPLRIQIDQKLILESDHINLTRAVKDYTTEAIVNGTKQSYEVLNGLRAGDKVTVIRAHGGQQYLVIDKE